MSFQLCHPKNVNTNSPTSSICPSLPKATADEDLILNYEARIRQLEAENAELKEKQVEISTAKELYLKIFEDFPALIWRSRLDKLCDYFNRTWLEWTGSTQEKEFGNGWTEGVHPDDFDACLATYVKSFDNHEPFYMEYRLRNQHGEYRWIGDHGRPFYDLDNTFLGYIGSCYDITDNKVNEQKLIELNATKDKFFSIVAHDLRNPISTFVSYFELLSQDDMEPGELTEIATQLNKDAKNTLMLLENLLDWSRSQSNEISFKPTLIDLENVSQVVISQVDVCAKAKRVTIETEIMLSPDWKIMADKNMIKAVLRNLLCNAIKFTPSGGTIRLKAEEHTNRYQQGMLPTKSVLISVSDDGVGISEERLPYLFDTAPGGTHKSSTRGTDNECGSGLGLVICKDFIEKHNGKIWAESVFGEGTTFLFTLPAQQGLAC
jgi:two-component system CheB/CheR fusion protein